MSTPFLRKKNINVLEISPLGKLPRRDEFRRPEYLKLVGDVQTRKKKPNPRILFFSVSSTKLACARLPRNRPLNLFSLSKKITFANHLSKHSGGLKKNRRLITPIQEYRMYKFEFAQQRIPSFQRPSMTFATNVVNVSSSISTSLFTAKINPCRGTHLLSVFLSTYQFLKMKPLGIQRRLGLACEGEFGEKED